MNNIDNHMNALLPFDLEYLELDLCIDHLFEDHLQEMNYIT
jgi:hypothetical protein